MNFLFPLIVVVSSAAALVWPDFFLVFKSWIIPLLGVSMFGMGMTLTLQDFRLILNKPGTIAVGLLGQYVIMASLAYGLAKVLRLPPEIALGVIMVGTCPGGVASNVMAYFARGDVALSVALTACSTIVSPLLTPTLTLLLADKWINVDAGAMFFSITKIVIIPVAAGMLLHKPLNRLWPNAPTLMPYISMLAIIIIITAIVAINSDNIFSIAAITILAVVLHNLLGMLLGYMLGKLCRYPIAQRRTLSLEVGLQNSGLAASLCRTHFTTYPAAMLPAAFFSIWHNISGSIVAGYWAYSDRKKSDKTGK